MSMTTGISRSRGGSGSVPPLEKVYGGGDDSGGEKIFFDDGMVKVTAALVTVGHPWNKAFAVSEISSVTFGKNAACSLTRSISKSMGTVILCGGALLGLMGFWQGLVFALISGVALLCAQDKKDAPYSVNISSGGLLATEYLSSQSFEWVEAVALAIQEAIQYRPKPSIGNDGGGEGFILPPQSRLRNLRMNN